MKKWSLTILLAATALISQAQNLRNYPAEILKYVNDYRGRYHLAPLRNNKVLSSICEEHSYNMAMGKTDFGHDGFDERVDDAYAKIGHHNAAAENVARGKLSARAVVDGWMHSSGHRHNILGNYTISGIGVSQSNDGGIYFTQLFLQ